MKVFDIVTDKEFLNKKCKEVKLPLSKKDEDTLFEMLEYLKNSQNKEIAEKYNIRPGVGLAANQIGIQKRMIAVYLVQDDVVTMYGLVNPKIISTSFKEAYLENGEGCLSVPKDVEGYVYRSYKITVKAYDVVSKKDVVIKARGYLAIILQHELDHLDGILYYERINKDNPFFKKDNAVAI